MSAQTALVDGAETVTFATVVRIADADGKPIREGSVLRSIDDGTQGVVVKITRAGDLGSPFDQVGNLKIRTGNGLYRCTNRYAHWRHVPRSEQTYEERHLAWFHDRDAFEYNGLVDEKEKSGDAKKAISGIMALLPEEIVRWDVGPWPDTVEDALRFLTEHLSSISRSATEGRS